MPLDEGVIELLVMGSLVTVGIAAAGTVIPIPMVVEAMSSFPASMLVAAAMEVVMAAEDKLMSLEDIIARMLVGMADDAGTVSVRVSITIPVCAEVTRKREKSMRRALWLWKGIVEMFGFQQFWVE